MSEHFNADELARLHSSMALHEAMTVRGEVVGDLVYMESPYNPDLVERIHKLTPKMGKWSGAKKRWVFPANRLDEVKALYKGFYGEDGFGEAPKATIELDIDKARAAGMPLESKSKALWFMGKQLARTFGKDKKPRVDGDVSVLSGGFVSAGTDNIVIVDPQPGTVIRVSGLPLDLLVQTLTGKGNNTGVTVTSTTAPGGMPTTPKPAATPNFGKAAAQAVTGALASGGGMDAGTAQQVARGHAPSTGAGVDPVMNDLADTATKAKYLQMQLMIKALATRTAQLPDDVVDEMLATVGLKRKK